MSLPFGVQEFVDVFRRYNEAVVPMQAVLVALALAAAGAALRGSQRASRAALVLLAFLWLWMAVAYHLAFFSTISPAGYVFAAMFAVQAALLARLATRAHPPRLAARADVRGVVAAALILFALVAYPVTTIAAGHRYPAMPTFGVPCPTTIFTLGVLLLATDRPPWPLVVVPALWTLIGTSAALLLGMAEDVGLTVAGLVAIPLLLRAPPSGPVTVTTRAAPVADTLRTHRRTRTVARVLVLLAVTGIGSYLAYAGASWLRYGHYAALAEAPTARTLDRYLPVYEVREMHETRVAAPAAVSFATTCSVDLYDSRVVRALFDSREMLMLHRWPATRPSQPLLHEIASLGWGMLSASGGRELVYGAVTRPWEGDVHFRALPATEFAAFDEPGYAKIVWSITVEPDGPDASLVRTETRVATTDPASRARFRRYWSFLSPGILLIRREALALMKHQAERARVAHTVARLVHHRPTAPDGCASHATVELHRSSPVLATGGST